MDLTSVVIESERLRLLPTSRRYAEAIFAEFTAAVTTYMFPAPAQRIDETLAFLADAEARLAAGTDLQVAILLRDTDEFLGHAGLHNLDTPTPELGIWTKMGAHGHGYGREAVTAVAFWALDNDDFDCLLYPVDRRNAPSRHIPESLGGQIAREYQQVNAAGNTLDLLEYRIGPGALRLSKAARVD